MSSFSPKLTSVIIIFLVGGFLLLRASRVAEGSERWGISAVKIYAEDTGAEKKGVFEYFSGVIKEIKTILIGVREGINLLSQLLSLMGIKVLIVLLLTLILTVGLRLLDLASGKTSFIISLTSISILWYFTNRVVRPDHSGDIRTILLTIIWVILPLMVFALVGWGLDKSGYLLKREFRLSSLARIFQRKRPLKDAGSVQAARRRLYDFENYSEQFSDLAHKALLSKNEEDKKEIELEMEILRRKIIDILSSGEEKS